MTEVLTFGAALDHPTIPVDVETELKCQLKIASSADFVPAAAESRSAMITNICLVFDCSGSMAGRKRETAIEAAKLIVDIVHERHRLSLVGFATTARVLVDNAHPTAEGREAIKKKIDKQIIEFGRGSTNLTDGLKKALKVVQKEEADAKVLVILSDGGANSPKEAHAAGMEATEAGLQLFAVGIGDDYEADRLLKLVTPSNGAVFGEIDLEKIKTTFQNLIGRIESFVATNTSLVVTLGEGVRAGQAYKTSPEQAVIGKMDLDAKRRVTLHVGNIEKDQTYSFLIAVTAPKRKAGKLEIARVALCYDAPTEGLHDQKKELAVSVEYTKGKQGEASAEVMDAFRGAQFVELVQGLTDAQRRRDAAKSAEILELLIRRSSDAGDLEGKAFYEDVLAELKEKGTISQRRLNDLVLGSTATLRRKKKGTQLYDVVLIDAGTSMIQVIRELREITGLDLRAVSDLVKAAPKTIQVLPFNNARTHKKRIQSAGAKVEVKAST